MGYVRYPNATREILDTVCVGDLIKINEWKVPLRVKAVSENYFVMTSKELNRDYYFLYECVNGEFKKLGKARSPLELEEKFKLTERMRQSP